MRHRYLPLAFVAACGLLLPTLVADEPQNEALDLSQIVSVVGGQLASVAAEDGQTLPKFEDVTKGMEAHKGLFTLWYYPASAQDKDQQKLLAQIPSGFLGEQFMLSTSIAGGGFLTGFPLDERRCALGTARQATLARGA